MPLLRLPDVARSAARRLLGRRGGDVWWRNDRFAPNACAGVFDTFEAARAACQPDKLVGYDNPVLAGWYRERLDRVYASDYPVLFWLAKLLPGATALFDFGGHVGVHYYASRPYLDHPEGLRWTVCEVPAVVAAGRALAAERGGGVAFTERVEDADGADVLLASGSLQYLEPGFLPAALARLRRPPRHLVVNKLPVHPEREYFTVQDTGPARHPYTIFARDRLLGALAAAGYAVRDAWSNPDLGCQVQGHPELSLSSYSGFCLERSAPPPQVIA